MKHEAISISGSGGKAGGSSRTPYEAPDNLLADSTAYLIDVVSEGEIEGWADPENPGTCIFFDDTPLQNPDGSFNFEGVEYWLRTGTPDQEPVPGFSAVESEVAVNAQVEQAQPIARSIASTDVDAVRVKVGVTNLSELDTSTGDLNTASVSFDVQLQLGAAGFETVGSYTIDGKTTSGYQRTIRVDLPAIRPATIRVVRTTPDSESSNLQNDLVFVSYTEVIDAKLRYPYTAYVALAVPAAAFGGRVPRRSYRLKGILCLVPSNYDPVSRTYDESTIWDGTFKRAYTNNAMWVSYTAYLDDRWGLGERISSDMPDKWAAYQIGKYCDGMVPDGQGGMQPRFTINGPLNTRRKAYEVITQLSASFRGATYWGAGAVVPVQDAPADPVKLVTNANAKDGVFEYSGTALDARKTVAVASFRHPEDHFKVKAGLVYEDQAAIARFGRRQTDPTLPFTTNRGEGLRAIKWAIDTNLTQTETVAYTAGLDHAGVRPYDVVLIADKHRLFFRTGGRIAAIGADGRSVTLDAPVEILAHEDYKILIADAFGAPFEAEVLTEEAASAVVLDLVAPLPPSVRAGAVFMMNATSVAPREFRVMSNVKEKQERKITAVINDPDKYARVEQGIFVTDEDPYVLPVQVLPSPPAAVDLQIFLRPDPGSKSKLSILGSWPRGSDPLVNRYKVLIREPKTAGWRDLGETQETSIEWTPQRDHPGIYQMRVHAINAFGEISGFTLGEVENTNTFERPSIPTGWVGEPGHDTITLTGNPHPAPDFKAFKIYGAADDDPTLIYVDETPATTYVRRVLVDGSTITRYRVTALNHNGDESLPTNFIDVVPTPSGLLDLDVQVSNAIAYAGAAADSAADDALQALTKAQQVEVDLGQAVTDLTLDYTVAQDAANDAGQSAGVANGHAVSAGQSAALAAASESIVANAALLLNAPLVGDGTGLTEHPGGLDPYAVSASRIVSEDGIGNVYQRTGFSNICPRVLIPAIAGTKYRFTALVRMIVNNVGGQNSNFFIQGTALDQTGQILSYIGLPGSAGSFSNARIADGWIELTGVFEIPADPPYAFIRPRVYHGWVSGGPNSDGTWQLRKFTVADVTDTEALSAEVNLLQIAQADTDGFAAAFAGLTAETSGGNIAGFRATSWEEPDGSGGATLELLGDVIAQGSMSTNRLTVGLGGNLLGNTDFSDGLAGWAFATNNSDQASATTIRLRLAGQTFAGSYFPTLAVYQNNEVASGFATVRYNPIVEEGVQSVGVPVAAGEWLEISAHMSAHRCICQLRIEYFDVNGVSLGASPVLSSLNDVRSSDNNPDLWPVYFGVHEAPATAAYATPMFRKQHTLSGGNSWMFVHKPQLIKTHADAPGPTPFHPGGTTLINGDKLATGSVTADKLAVNELSAVAASIGVLQSATSGERLELRDDVIKVYNAAGQVVIQIGNLDA
ncbi:MAG: phage tail protein [Pseudomonadota bacterium]